jgi:hypothetical protein
MRTKAAIAVAAGKPLEILGFLLKGREQARCSLRSKPPAFVTPMTSHFQEQTQKASFLPPRTRRGGRLVDVGRGVTTLKKG